MSDQQKYNQNPDSNNRKIFYFHTDDSCSIHRGKRKRSHERITLSSRVRLANCVNKMAEGGRVTIRLSLVGWAAFEVERNAKYDVAALDSRRQRGTRQ